MAITPIRYLTTINRKSIYIKQDYLNHPSVQGNKLRKLKYNLLSAKANQQTLISFGGAHSNHIAALAAAGKQWQLPTVGIIRGEELAAPNRWCHTLNTAHANGMQLHFVNRKAYREKNNNHSITHIIAQYPNGLVIPEGGSNALAVQGSSEIIDEIRQQIPTELPNVDYLFAACGTGGTLAGMIDGILTNHLSCQLHGIAVLKGADFLTKDIQALSQHHAAINWDIKHHYHHGGYAKTSQDLHDFIQHFEHTYHIPLDPIYTGKLVYAVFDLAKQSTAEKGENWLIYHSGGLQGKPSTR